MVSGENVLAGNPSGNDGVVFRHLAEYHPILQSPPGINNNCENITDTFIQTSPVEIAEHLFRYNYQDWMVYTMLVLMFGISVVWFYFPERALSIFKIADRKTGKRSNYSKGDETPGMLILFFFIINSLLTISLFLYLAGINLGLLHVEGDNWKKVLLYVFAGIVAFYIFRVAIIYFTGMIFKTKTVALNQLKVYINIDNIAGVLLIPVLMVILFAQFNYLIYAGIILLAVLYLIKWVQTFILGISISGFSSLHLFMYLCTLELLPILVIVKLFNNAF